MSNSVSLMFVYEPASGSESIPLARISDQNITVDVARRAVLLAKNRARRMMAVDQEIGRLEQMEAQQLDEILSVLLASTP